MAVGDDSDSVKKKLDSLINSSSNPHTDAENGRLCPACKKNPREQYCETDMSGNFDRKYVLLIKLYPLLKEEMKKTTANCIATRLLKMDKAQLIFNCNVRRLAVDRLLKHVLADKDALYKFWTLMRIKEHWKSLDIITQAMEEKEPEQNEIEVCLSLKNFDSDTQERCQLYPDDRDELFKNLKDLVSIDTLNNEFLARFFFSVNAHDNICDYLHSSNYADGLSCLFTTMETCSKTIMHAFCELLESRENKHMLVEKLQLRKKYCDKETVQNKSCQDAEERSIFRKVLDGLKYCRERLSEVFGFTVTKAQQRCLILTLSPDTEMSWSNLRKHCTTGKIREMLEIILSDVDSMNFFFVNDRNVLLSIYSVITDHTENKDQRTALVKLDILSPEEVDKVSFEAEDPTETYKDLFYEELEISDGLIKVLKEKHLVPSDVSKQLERTQTRVSEIECLLKNIFPLEEGYKVIKDYQKISNEYLFEKLEALSDRKELFYWCVAKVGKTLRRQDYMSNTQSNQQEVKNPIESNMDLFCEELEVSLDLINELRRKHLVTDRIYQNLKRTQTRRAEVKCLLQNISPPNEGYLAIKEHIKSTNTHLFQDIETRDKEIAAKEHSLQYELGVKEQIQEPCGDKSHSSTELIWELVIWKCTFKGMGIRRLFYKDFEVEYLKYLKDIYFPEDTAELHHHISTDEGKQRLTNKDFDVEYLKYGKDKPIPEDTAEFHHHISTDEGKQRIANKDFEIKYLKDLKHTIFRGFAARIHHISTDEGKQRLANKDFDVEYLKYLKYNIFLEFAARIHHISADEGKQRLACKDFEVEYRKILEDIHFPELRHDISAGEGVRKLCMKIDSLKYLKDKYFPEDTAELHHHISTDEGIRRHAYKDFKVEYLKYLKDTYFPEDTAEFHHHISTDEGIRRLAYNEFAVEYLKYLKDKYLPEDTAESHHHISTDEGIRRLSYKDFEVEYLKYLTDKYSPEDINTDEGAGRQHLLKQMKTEDAKKAITTEHIQARPSKGSENIKDTCLGNEDDSKTMSCTTL